jgi:N-acetylneuraminic acid mutarotase
MMKRFLVLICVVLLVRSRAGAHFVFVVPQSDLVTSKVIVSEDLQPDADVDIGIISKLKLVSADLKGNEMPLKLEKIDHAMAVDLSGIGTRIVHGSVELGVEQLDKSKPFLLVYFPKTILGDAFNPATHLKGDLPVELMAIGAPGKFHFQMLAAGKPVAAAEINLILPDHTHQKLIANAKGETEDFTTPGRYGLWSRNVAVAAGERDGKKFEEIHRYATLVVDIPAGPVITTFPSMPEPASSFGAVACDGWLYLYGGHVVDTHSYDTQSVSGRFSRLNLANHQSWEPLPGGPALQGLNLATWHGKIYRVGGMNPHNKPDQPEDVRSVADCACFDPANQTWTKLPDMPEPRSSHDVVVVGNQLIVIGGWTLKGDPDDAHWLDSVVTLDLAAAKPQWKSFKQPFERRAFIAASYHGKAYVIGGFGDDSEPTKRVDIYDPATDRWTAGPQLPGGEINGFGAAACIAGDRLYVSVADGHLYELDEKDDEWVTIARTMPRIVHRLVANGSQILVIGGSAGKKQSALIEAVQLPTAPVAH